MRCGRPPASAWPCCCGDRQRYLRRRTDLPTAEDVLADVLLALWRRLDDVPADASLPYAYGVARRCLADSRRSAGRQDRVVARLARQRLRDDGDPDDLLDGFLLDGRKSGDPTGQTGTSRKGGGGR